MVAELCLMASHGYLPGLVLHQEQGRILKDSQHLLPSSGAKHEIIRSRTLTMRSNHYEETLKPLCGLADSSQFVQIDSTVKKPVLIDVQDDHPDSILFSFGISEQCTKHEKILKFLMSGPSEVERREFDMSLLSDLMGLQALNVYQQPTASLFYPNCELFSQKPPMDFVGDLACGPKFAAHQDGRVVFMGTGMEAKDLLSVVAEVYLSRNSPKWRKPSMLVPQYNRLGSNQAVTNVQGSSLKVQTTTVVPLKSPDKVKVKPSPKKKNKRKVGRERDECKKNYFRACESLLSIMVDKRYNGKRAILSLKKSGPELPELLTQFSAGIAGTGLAVLFSVISKLACGRVPFCASKLLSTSFGFGLVWLSWAVNKLGDTILYIIKNSGKLNLKEEEIMRKMDKSVKEICFGTATLMVVAMLKFA
ncbi:hypothetical protein I3843_07G093200 [Carya illinoinensis]|uniref:Uncharacterized protein n=1 Tax=Carya illinoinensis TaxID=32201 RepID=A0A922EIS8_CARIL|nr:hypothetical protein I3842_07G097900 [Carya illinoinensis]KAG7970608.1 hypothetical protein I3843_07G093200 [Carya illinoinensis]